MAADGNGDGVGDINFLDYNLNGAPSDLASDLLPKSESLNILAYGETTLEGDMNITPYFEAMYNTYEVNQNSGEGQLFPNVPALNPYNLCNPNAENGVDCGLGYDAYLTNQHRSKLCQLLLRLGELLRRTSTVLLTRDLWLVGRSFWSSRDNSYRLSTRRSKPR